MTGAPGPKHPACPFFQVTVLMLSWMSCAPLHINDVRTHRRCHSRHNQLFEASAAAHFKAAFDPFFGYVQAVGRYSRTMTEAGPTMEVATTGATTEVTTSLMAVGCPNLPMLLISSLNRPSCATIKGTLCKIPAAIRCHTCTPWSQAERSNQTCCVSQRSLQIYHR